MSDISSALLNAAKTATPISKPRAFVVRFVKRLPPFCLWQVRDF